MTISTFRFTALIIAAAFLSGCTSDEKDAAKILQVMERDNPAEFESVMRTFIDRALQGDIDGMIALTSKVTIDKSGGIEEMKKHYTKDTSPALKLFPNMSDGGRVDYTVDEFGSRGWTFKKVFQSPSRKNANFQFVVLKESGTIKVSSFGLWK